MLGTIGTPKTTEAMMPRANGHSVSLVVRSFDTKSAVLLHMIKLQLLPVVVGHRFPETVTTRIGCDVASEDARFSRDASSIPTEDLDAQVLPAVKVGIDDPWLAAIEALLQPALALLALALVVLSYVTGAATIARSLPVRLHLRISLISSRLSVSLTRNGYPKMRWNCGSGDSSQSIPA